MLCEHFDYATREGEAAKTGICPTALFILYG